MEEDITFIPGMEKRAGHWCPAPPALGEPSSAWNPTVIWAAAAGISISNPFSSELIHCFKNALLHWEAVIWVLNGITATAVPMLLLRQEERSLWS